MQRIVHDKGSVIVPFFRNWIYARRANVQHGEGKLTSSWPLDGARGAERWWFASEDGSSSARPIMRQTLIHAARLAARRCR